MKADPVVWHGAEGLRDRLVPIDEVILLPDNARQGDIGAISVSLDRLGQQKAIVVDVDGVILAGNHLTQAAREIGWTHIAREVSNLEGEDKTRYVLADNRLSDLGDYDNDLLIAQLQALTDLDGVGYDLDDLDDLIAYSQEDLHFADGATDTKTIQEREALREAARAAGMEVRSLVFLLSSGQYAWAVTALASRGAANHTEAFLDVLAEVTGEAAPGV